MEILIFAAVAAVVLARLYMVLGQNRGAEPPPVQRPQPVDIFQRQGGSMAPSAPANDAAGPDLDAAAANTVRVSQYGPAASGLEAIAKRDRAFAPEAFLTGARGAYQMIVEAYGRNDTAALRDLLTPDTLTAYEAAIQERIASSAARIEVVRLSDAKIVAAELVGNRAEIDVHFSADLADGGDGLRPTDEVWSFERDVTSRDPAWLLCGVATV